jgi:hypothetical protein
MEGDSTRTSHGLQLVAPVSFCMEPPLQASHSSNPFVGALLPARHAFGCTAPPGHSNPLPQLMHSFASVAFGGLYVPGEQAAANGTLLP